MWLRIYLSRLAAYEMQESSSLSRDRLFLANLLCVYMFMVLGAFLASLPFLNHSEFRMVFLPTWYLPPTQGGIADKVLHLGVYTHTQFIFAETYY